MELKRPKEPVKLALIGAGSRASNHYRRILPALWPWLEVVAVCDPVREHADRLAERLGVRPFYDLRELVKAGIMEAAVVVTPIPSHHSISVYLSSHGVPNMVETSMASTLRQGREMVAAAREHGVVLRVAENFFRMPIDRIVQRIVRERVIGETRRIFSYNDHTGYHNNSRWIVFAGSHPLWVQSIAHTMPTVPFHSTAVRFHDSETFRSRFFMFPGEFLVIDQAANIKGLLGRHPRPGYTEWHGERGTVMYRSTRSTRLTSLRPEFEAVGEVRLCTDEGLERWNGQADLILPIVHEYGESDWIRSYVDLPQGRLEYENPIRLEELVSDPSARNEIMVPYHTALMGHLIDFALAVRGLGEGEYTADDALMAMMMEAGARESALAGGKRIELPIATELESDRLTLEREREQFGVDPLDIEAMISFAFPKP